MVLPWVELVVSHDGMARARLCPWRVFNVTHSVAFGDFIGVELEIEQQGDNGDVYRIKLPAASVEIDAAWLMSAVMNGTRS